MEDHAPFSTGEDVIRADTNGRPVGKLIALEGKEAAEMAALAQALKNALELEGYECVISRCNASQVFSELLEARVEGTEKMPSRTLAMLHAADLAQRINNVIRSALRSGLCVIADQYVYTSVAVALALGADPSWISNLYAFAPKPHKAFYLKSSKESSPYKATPLDVEKEGFGFYQFCLKLIITNRLRSNPLAFEKSVDQEFDRLVEQNKLKVIRPEDDSVKYEGIEIRRRR